MKSKCIVNEWLDNYDWCNQTCNGSDKVRRELWKLIERPVSSGSITAVPVVDGRHEQNKWTFREFVHESAH